MWMKSAVLFLDGIRKVIRQGCRFVPYEKAELALASLGEDANLIGAARVCTSLQAESRPAFVTYRRERRPFARPIQPIPGVAGLAAISSERERKATHGESRYTGQLGVLTFSYLLVDHILGPIVRTSLHKR